MIKYPSIEQFRNVVRTVRTSHDYKGKDAEGNPIIRNDSPYPTLTFRGTVKLHGTNAGIVLYKDGRIEFQSRERVLSLEKDNAGFYAHMVGIKESLRELFLGFEFEEYVAIYGEWCGGNIQKGVAISGLPKMFWIFDIVVDGKFLRAEQVISICQPKNQIYNIHHMDTIFIDIDFNRPEMVQNDLIELTLRVEEECPVGRFFGKSGIGEGLVFSWVDNPGLKFKSKGEKHSSSKVKTLNSVDVEVLQGLQDFVDYACTDNRMTQGLEHVELDIKNTGDFVRWVVNDILKEEKDTLLQNKIEWKSVSGMIGKKASSFFRSKL